MNIIKFQKQLAPYQIFSLQDIRKLLLDFSYRQIDRWEKKGYLLKIKQGFYALSNQNINQNFAFLTANKIYSPSYISIEKALKFYKLIPEEVFQITSVSTKKTTGFETHVGNFTYRHIDSKLFWGYKLMKFGDYKFLLAEPEKAILDYLYLHANLKTYDDFVEMRINIDSFQEQIDLKKFQRYLNGFKNKSLIHRANVFLDTIQND
jgi:predicted transcriptional regulator of viral defense system